MEIKDKILLKVYEDDLEGEERDFVRVKHGVKEIKRGAFDSLDSLRYVLLPPSVKLIDSHAFINCPSFEMILICKPIKVKKDSFINCNKFKIFYVNQDYDNVVKKFLKNDLYFDFTK